MPEPTAGRWPSSFGVSVTAEGGVVRVWAPEAQAVLLRAADGAHADTPLARAPSGCFSGSASWLRAGARYWIVLDDERVMPDPASRFQPDGVHGPSEVIDSSVFDWRCEDWRRPSIDDLVIYELHVGTFTEAGTFSAAESRLEALAELGITAVELMPIAAFPGRWNWGYDPAAFFAPSERYGRPDDLCRFVDRAHALGLAVLLDVVYNHFGPDGAYAAAFSPAFFSERHTSPWGAGINLDGPGSGVVRRFFIENALQWLVDYRMDGLRLDATHALVDDSPEPFLAELSRTVHEATGHRGVLLIAEDNRNLRILVEPRASGGCGLDGVWSDDFHHVARRLAAGDHESYFADFAGTTSELARTLADGWLYKGERSVHAGGPRGTDPAGLPLPAFVICLQNHDQVGNRAMGDRLHHSADAAVVRALTVLLLLAPETPLLFMGQEWAASSPFLYFTDHEGDLGRRVREGRRLEFGQFAAFADPAARDSIPDPQDAGTFERSHLAWHERDQPPHAGIVRLHRRALAVRKMLTSAGLSGDAGSVEVAAAAADGTSATSSGSTSAVVMRRDGKDGAPVVVVARLSGAGAVRVPRATGWRPAAEAPLVDTEAADVVADPRPATVAIVGDAWQVDFARPGALVLRVEAS